MGIEKTQVKSSCVRFHLVKFEAFEVCFLGLPYEPFLWSYFIEPIFFFKALEKSKKECNMLEIILVQGFCPLKIKIIILIFLMDPS